jgi:hypothetical protein
MRFARPLALLSFAALLVGLAMLGEGGLLLSLLPTVALAIPLLFEHYPGEAVLDRLRPEASAPRAPRRAAARVSPLEIPRHGALLATALGRRGPPAGLPASA